MKKMRWQPVIFLLVLLILCGAAGAADIPWNLRSALTRENGQGEKEVNEELLRLAQDVRQTFTGEYLRVTVADALFDGNSLMVAWEVENLSGQPVYLMSAPVEGSANWQGGQMIGGPSEEFVRPGQQRNGFMDCEILKPIEGDTMHIGIHYYVLTPTVELIYVQQPEPVEIADLNNLTPQEQDYVRKMLAAEAERDTRLEEGKFVVETSNQTDWLQMGNAFYEEMIEQYELVNYECTNVEAMIGTGKFALLEELEIEFDLKVTENIASFLPNGEPVEKEYEDFTMRVTRADYTTGTMEIIVEVTFADSEVTKNFTGEGRLFVALDEEGLLVRDGGISDWGKTGRQEERDDGTWMVEYVISHRQLFTLPESVTVCPAILVSNGGVLSADGLMEGVVLTLR